MANKTVNKETNLVDFSGSAEVIKKTAKSINTQVREVATEVSEELRENGSNLAEKAMAPIKEAYSKVTETVNLENIAEATKNANDYTIKTAEEIIDGVIENSAKWQDVAEKAINGGLKIAAKQQEMVFGTMETVKDQFTTSTKRLKNLVYSKPEKVENEDN